MFFSWHIRNRHFKPKSNCSGQIFPVLLICLAGLLVAVGVTIGVGEANKTKTYTSNAADAGSLAAASYWAGAFNKLVARNKELETYTAGNFGYYMDKSDTYQYYKEMYDYYPEMRGYYLTLYELGKQYLTDKSHDNALYYSQGAEGLAWQALDEIIKDPGKCAVWVDQYTGAWLNALNPENSAAGAARQSAKCLGAFFILTQYMAQITDFFKSMQTANFCEAKDFMDGAYDKSRKTGLSYAFSNSGTSGDNFYYWLGTGKFYAPPSNSATYKWESGTRRDGTPKYCGITATLDLPKISSYTLKHTKWNYPKKHALNVVAIPCIHIADATISDDPFNIESSLKLMNDMLAISGFLADQATRGIEIRDLTIKMKECCDSRDAEGNPNCDPTPKYEQAKQLQVILTDYQNCVISGLHKINTLLGDNLTIPTLKKWNIDIFDNLWAEKVGDFPSVKTCEDVENYLDESEYPGMMVINIESVRLDPAAWTTQCTVFKFCEDEDGNSQGATSTSTSRFDGGDIGKFKDEYYPEIINAS